MSMKLINFKKNSSKIICYSFLYVGSQILTIFTNCIMCEHKPRGACAHTNLAYILWMDAVMNNKNLLFCI